MVQHYALALLVVNSVRVMGQGMDGMSMDGMSMGMGLTTTSMPIATITPIITLSSTITVPISNISAPRTLMTASRTSFMPSLMSSMSMGMSMDHPMSMPTLTGSSSSVALISTFTVEPTTTSSSTKGHRIPTTLLAMMAVGGIAIYF